LEQIAEDYKILGQLEIEIHTKGRETALPEEVKLGFFRIAQEALSNIRKHAKATKATISLLFFKKRISMIVTDNGVGFDFKKTVVQSSTKGSLGLLIMKERADLIGARLRIESKPQRGTNVKVKIALKVF
jgi:two-component system sensor histidine kinase DegS